MGAFLDDPLTRRAGPSFRRDPGTVDKNGRGGSRNRGTSTTGEHGHATGRPGHRPVSARLLAARDPEGPRLARRLAVIFHDSVALRRCLAIALDVKKPIAERIDAVHDLTTAHPREALRPLEELLTHDPSADLRCEI